MARSFQLQVVLKPVGQVRELKATLVRIVA